MRNPNYYYDILAKYPPLKKEEEEKYMLLAKAGDKRAYDKIVCSNLRFVVNVAKEYLGQGLEFEDLIGEGNMGLVKAFHKFDITRENRFITYAVWWIRQAILQALLEHPKAVKLPANRQAEKRSIRKARYHLEEILEREPSLVELEEYIGYEIDPTLLQDDYVMSLDHTFNNGNDDDKNLLNVVIDKLADDPEDESTKQSFRQELQSILSNFDEREQQIIKMYHGIDYVRCFTLEEIGIEFDLTRERIRQIKKQVLEKLGQSKFKEKLIPYLK
tara:strand:- start:6280 stop:7098 length:819 start_codon:yes stop_codon:yes gene_type:complete